MLRRRPARRLARRGGKWRPAVGVGRSPLASVGGGGGGAAGGRQRCYEIQRLVESTFPGSVALENDYVASPKPNAYQSLHLAVRLPALGDKIEVQIRTRHMHAVAELGSAAHAAYKRADAAAEHARPPLQLRP